MKLIVRLTRLGSLISRPGAKLLSELPLSEAEAEGDRAALLKLSMGITWGPELTGSGGTCWTGTGIRGWSGRNPVKVLGKAGKVGKGARGITA